MKKTSLYVAISLMMVLSMCLAVMAFAGIEEQYALETATGGNYRIWIRGNHAYEGFYNGTKDGCHLVSIKKAWKGKEGETLRDSIYNYKVCGDKVMDEGESSLVYDPIPKGIKSVAQSVATQAQKYGQAEGQYQGFDIKGKALRDKDKCAVEIRIMKGNKLYGVKKMNGCS